MADKYRIKEINDFLQIPDTKLEKCLDEFKAAVLMTKAMQGLADAVADTIGVKEHIFLPEFTWVDDDEKKITINLVPVDSQSI